MLAHINRIDWKTVSQKTSTTKSLAGRHQLARWHTDIATYNVHTQPWRALYDFQDGSCSYRVGLWKNALVLLRLVFVGRHLFLPSWLGYTCWYQVGFCKWILTGTKLVGDQQWPLLAPLTLATLPSHPCSTGYNITKHEFLATHAIHYISFLVCQCALSLKGSLF